MGNLLGKNFRGWITTQVGIRQNKLSQTNKDNENLVWQTNNSSWLRLISSVNVSSSKSKELTKSENNSGRVLATKYVLSGGTGDYSIKGEDYTNSLKYGVMSQNFKDDELISGFNSYGFTSTKDRGLVPMPGIESATIESLNMGSLRKAEIKIHAHNKEQFAIIDALYMRPGFTILLEWGHTLYFNNKGELQKGNNITTAFNNMLKGGVHQNKILQSIDKQREETGGNYDGFFGKIVNFDWTFTNEGSYDITIKAYSIGDIIESLNINKAISNISTSPKPTIGPPTEADSLSLAFNSQYKSKLNKFVYETYNKLNSQDSTEIKPRSEFSNLIKYKSLKFKECEDYKNLSYNNSHEGIHLEIPPPEGQNFQYNYIMLGILLRYIEKELLIYNKKGERYIGIDTDMSSNLCYKFPYQFSIDPSVCLIPFKQLHLVEGSKTLNAEKSFETFHQILSSEFIRNEHSGKLMAIHVNLDFINKTFDSCVKSKDNTVVLLDFLTRLMEGIQGALGGINKFTVSYDSEDNKIKIYDNIILNENVLYKEPGVETVFQTLGVSNNAGSFIKNISLNASIPSEYASMIAIGAQANGISDIANATSFSTWNKGLTDSTFEEKFSYNKSQIKEDIPDPFNMFYKNWKQIIGKGSPLLNFYGGGFKISSTEIENTSLPSSEAFKYLANYFSVTYHRPSIQGFIPFDLGLEMLGISGPRIYERFAIDDKILPPSYPQYLSFLIKGIRHDINLEGWTTTLTSLAYESSKDSIALPTSYNIVVVQDEILDEKQNITINKEKHPRDILIRELGWPVRTEEQDGQVYGFSIKPGSNILQRNDNWFKDNTESYKVLINGKEKQFYNVNKLMKTNFDILLTRIRDAKLEDGIIDLDLSVSSRFVRGSEERKILSAHAFGYAFDINWNLYPQGQNGYILYQNDLKGGKKTAKVIDFISKTGLFFWGGDFNNNKDVMHFSLKWSF